MEKMKKVWGRPMTKVEAFTPNKYVAGCDGVYRARCDVPTSYVFLDDGDGEFEPAEDNSLLPRHVKGCENLHYFHLDELPTKHNAFIVTDVSGLVPHTETSIEEGSNGKWYLKSDVTRYTVQDAFVCELEHPSPNGAYLIKVWDELMASEFIPSPGHS